MLVSMTIAELLRKTARGHEKDRALFSDERTLTYGELDILTDRIAAGLRKEGLRYGDIVGLFCNTSVEMAVFYYALQKAGLRTILFPEKMSEDAIDNYFRFSEQKAIVCDEAHFRMFGNLPFMDRFPLHFLAGSSSRDGWKGVYELTKEADEENLREVLTPGNPEDTAVMLFTSGSTGIPKLVCSSGYSRVNGGIQQAVDQRMTGKDIVLEALPIHHCFALSVNIMAAMSVGASVYFPKDRHTKTIRDAIIKHRCTVLSAVPTLYNALIVKQNIGAEDISLRTGIIGGGRYTAEQFEMIDRAFGKGFTLMSSLGMTEGTAGVTTCELSDELPVRSATVGHFLTYVEGKILDPGTGKELPRGEKGEICFKGYNVMQGYYENPEETKRVIDRDGYLHSGDLGWMDESGYVHMAGRLKELIIRGGENISPAEVENALLKDHRITDCRAVGLPDAHWGEVVGVCIVAEGITEKDVFGIASQNLPKQKQPEYVLLLDALPVNANNKVDFMECRRMISAKYDINMEES